MILIAARREVFCI